eukprot:5406818-Amphidinium_carterae.1
MMRRMNFVSAASDVEPTFPANREGKQCSTGVNCEQPSSKGSEQLVTCWEGGVLVYQNSFRRALQAACVASPADRAALSIRGLQAPILDDETWISDTQTSETDAKGGAFGNAKVEALGEMMIFPGRPRGFDSELEEWNFYLNAAKHFEELERDVASHRASHPNWISSAKLSWRKIKTGRRRARRVGSGGTQSNLPTVEEEKACDAFLERKDVDQPDDFERRGLDRRIIFTRPLWTKIP